MTMQDYVWRILLVDDDEDDYYLTREMLSSARREKYTLEWASTYQAGLEALLTYEYDAVLMDYDLGASSGVDLIREAVAGGCDSPIIMLTGRGSYEVDVEAMQAGASDYISKSEVSSAFLERSIRYAIDRKRIETDLAQANEAYMEANLALADANAALQHLNQALQSANANLDHERLRLQAVIEHAPAGILLTDRSGKVILSNLAIRRMLGQEMPAGSKELIELFPLFTPDGTPLSFTSLPIIRALEEGEISQNLEVLLRHPGGESYALINSGPVMDAANNITGAVVVVQDITRRKNIEQHNLFLAQLSDALLSQMEPETAFRLVTERIGRHLNASLCLLDEEIVGNESTRQLHGFMPDRGVFVLEHKLIQDSPGILTALRAGKHVVIEDIETHPLTAGEAGKLYRSLGMRSLVVLPRIINERWIGSLAVLMDHPRQWQSEEIEMLSTANDLVWLAIENARTFQSWKTAEERFRIALSNAPITVFSMDLHLRYTWMYPTGQLMEELMGKRLDELVEPNQGIDDIMSFFQEVLKTGRSQRGEFRVRFPNTEWHYLITAEPIFDSRGRVLGLIGAALDISEQRRLEARHVENTAQMEVQRRLLEQREMERQQIARDLHDGPIQNLIGLRFPLQSLLEFCSAPDMEMMVQALDEDLLRLVTELREVCNELRPPALMRFGLEGAIKSHIEDFQRKNQHIRVNLEIPGEKSNLPDNLRLALYRIYQESLNNVARHAGAAQVTVRLVAESEQIRLEVQDTGKGFTMNGDWVDLVRQGHLGLVGMKERAEAVGGRLEVHSAPGKGTLIRVVVPWKDEQEEFTR